MKYRTDFVTNSSSSSSVVINIKSKSETIHTISYDIGIYTENLNVVKKTYQSIMSILVNSEMIGIICNNSLDRSEYLEISGTNDVYLDKEKIMKYLKSHSDKTSSNLEKLLKLQELMDLPVDTYEGFIGHPYWDFIGVYSAKEIQRINEVLTVSGDDYPYTIKTNVSVKQLKDNQKLIDETPKKIIQSNENEDMTAVRSSKGEAVAKGASQSSIVEQDIDITADIVLSEPLTTVNISSSKSKERPKNNEDHDY